MLGADLLRFAQGVAVVAAEGAKLQRTDLIKKCGNFYINNATTPQLAAQTVVAVMGTLGKAATPSLDQADATGKPSTRPVTPFMPPPSTPAFQGPRSYKQTESRPREEFAKSSQEKTKTNHSNPPQSVNTIESKSTFKPREVSVPASPMARVFGFGSLGARIAFGTVWDRIKQPFQRRVPTNKSVDSKSAVSTPASDVTASQTTEDAKHPAQTARIGLSEANMERLTAGLCRMRGAALKIGQMLSIQDESLIPPQLAIILERVRDGADVMPRKQLERTLVSELGSDWQRKLKSFDFLPIAAASIGQVHRAIALDGREVVLKVQYPGVADSISSDIDNLQRILQMTGMFPRGFFLEEAIESAKEELTLECDYLYEADSQKKFQKLVRADPSLRNRINVPDVIAELSTRRILATSMVPGVPIDRLIALQADQCTRDSISLLMIELCLKELFEWRLMQTDPNWSNFLYDSSAKVPGGGVEGKGGMLQLIDFGATREYPQEFVDEYLRMVQACAERRREEVLDSSIKLGFLTGEESKRMLQAHVEASFIIGEPFGSEGPYDFVKGNIAARASAQAAIMLQERLKPPRKEVYTLHRKLSGAFLTCKKLNANIDCGPIFYDILARRDGSS
eukprot:gb/GEZN01003350.1/.p1 GENE.gb/GEZN01003350.1/~~gb/GEZN01003350.1/.p1  ORF type:complete len:624 (-),score=70.43 gb/GEZN01003350.1/:270-2141(-)